jgi:hypothetical protein
MPEDQGIVGVIAGEQEIWVAKSKVLRRPCSAQGRTPENRFRAVADCLKPSKVIQQMVGQRFLALRAT